jgi:hypothetical protein
VAQNVGDRPFGAARRVCKSVVVERGNRVREATPVSCEGGQHHSGIDFNAE